MASHVASHLHVNELMDILFEHLQRGIQLNQLTLNRKGQSQTQKAR